MEVLIYTSNPSNLAQLQKGLDIATLITIQKNLGAALQTFKENSFQKIIVEPSTLSELNQTSLHSLYSVLKPGGLLQIQPPTQQSNSPDSFKDLFTIAGFKQEAGDNGQNLVLSKPSWAGKGVATLKKKNNTNAAPANGTSTVKIGVEDETVLKNSTQNNASSDAKKANPFAAFSNQAVNNKQTIDEENLLKDETGYNKLGNDESCSTKPKACANCSCGRAELEAAAEAGEPVDLAKNVETGKVTSSCGNCYLGDAFRCGSCPYKGLPAFKPGDKVKLDLTKDGIGAILKEENDVVVSNGKVKLQI
jgi:hypothetical protein